MGGYTTRPLALETWDAFVQLCEKHNGVSNGCWCTWFHPACAEKGKSSDGNRAYKKRLVRDGKAHAALVFDGDVAVGWCECFDYERPKGKGHCVMRKVVPSA